MEINEEKLEKPTPQGLDKEENKIIEKNEIIDNEKEDEIKDDFEDMKEEEKELDFHEEEDIEFKSEDDLEKIKPEIEKIEIINLKADSILKKLESVKFTKLETLSLTEVGIRLLK